MKSNNDKQKPIAWAFVIALILGGIVVFFAISGRTNQLIEQKKAENAAQEAPVATPEAAPVTGEATPSEALPSEAAPAVDASQQPAAGEAPKAVPHSTEDSD